MDLSERGPSTERHPWELARAAFLLDLLVDRDDGVAEGEDVLDVGSGDAFFARLLVERTRCRVTCWDSHYSDADLAALGGPGLTLTKTAPTTSFRTALLLDVIEHVGDDVGLLRAAAARVVPGGTVLVSVPAWPGLFSSHDTALKHVRRYTPDACRAVLHQAGLTIVASGGFFHSLLVPRAASVLVEKVAPPQKAGVGAWRGGPWLTRAVTAVLRAEQRVSTTAARLGADLPGLSFFALCRT